MKLLTSCLLLILLSFTSAIAQKMTDRELAGLKGKVKLVQETEEKVSPKASKEEPNNETEYDRAGNLLMRSSYLSGMRTIYYLIDGYRASRSEEFAEPKLKLQPIASIMAGPNSKPPENQKADKKQEKADPRFEDRYEYKYDAAGRIARKTEYTNTGERDAITEYEYSKEGRLAVETMKDPDGSKFIDTYRYDASGLLLERISKFIYKNGETQFTLSYKYSGYKLDGNGNWTERKESQKHADDPKEVPNVTIQRRRLTYF